MEELTPIAWLTGAATLLLYIWIIWTACANGRNALLWFFLTFLLTPWLVALLLRIIGESDAKIESRQLPVSMDPDEAELIRGKREKEAMERFFLGLIALTLYMVSVAWILISTL